MARPRAIAGVGPGSHSVRVHPGDRPARQFTAADLLIAHAPFSTPERFVRKVRNIRAELAQNPACYHHDLGWHWKRWAAMTDRDAIDVEFAGQMLDDTELARLRQGNAVRSAQEIFQERLQSLLDVRQSA